MALHKIETKVKPYRNLTLQWSYTVFVCAEGEREARRKARQAILNKTHGEAHAATLLGAFEYVTLVYFY